MQKKTRNLRENTQAMKPNSTQRFWESSKKSDTVKKILHNVFSSPVKKANTPVKKATQ